MSTRDRPLNASSDSTRRGRAGGSKSDGADELDVRRDTSRGASTEEEGGSPSWLGERAFCPRR
jgi:hypothetical protein